MTRAKRPPGRPRTYVPPQLVYELRQKGLSFREIARQTGFGYGSVRRAYQVFLQESGRPQ